jgi:hypothetical protein
MSEKQGNPSLPGRQLRMSRYVNGSNPWFNLFVWEIAHSKGSNYRKSHPLPKPAEPKWSDLISAWNGGVPRGIPRHARLTATRKHSFRHEVLTLPFRPIRDERRVAGRSLYKRVNRPTWTTWGEADAAHGITRTFFCQFILPLTENKTLTVHGAAVHRTHVKDLVCSRLN